MMISIAAVAIGGFLGSMSRFAFINLLKKHYSFTIPVPTVVVNLVGSFFLGLLVGLDVENFVYMLFGIGFLGAFTTFSTLAVEGVQLISSGKKKGFLLYIFLSFIGGILFAFIGFWTGNLTF